PAPIVLFSFQHPAPPVFYTLSLHDALPISPRRRQHSVALPRRREDRLGVRVVNVAHEGPSAGLLLSAITVRCPPAPNRTPAAKGAHQFSYVPRQALARGAEPRAPPALDPAAGIHKAAHDIETCFA